jgi:hypothetical protein
MILSGLRPRQPSTKWTAVSAEHISSTLSVGIVAAPHTNSFFNTTNELTVSGIVVAAAVAVGIAYWRKVWDSRAPLTAAEVTELVEYLKIGERVVVQFDDADVLTAAQLVQLKIRELIDGARGIAGRGTLPIYRAAADLAAAATEVTKAVMPEEQDVIAAYSASGSGVVPSSLTPRSIAQIGIRQERAIRDLKAKIDATWAILRSDKRHAFR